MSVAVEITPRAKLRFAGRTFLAFVLEPSTPIAEWLADLDRAAQQSPGFFANRPVILDLSGLSLNRTQTGAIFQAITARDIRVVAVEGIDPTFLPRGMAPLAGGLESSRTIDMPRAAEMPKPISSKIVDNSVRSGQSIFFPTGDLTILGSVSSGAEVIAGGSIHVNGVLRGRAIAGCAGDAKARIFCQKFEAELVAIDGCYLTSEECGSARIGKPVQVRLIDNAITLNPLG